MKRIFFDTEFIDTGSTIDLISLGLVDEDGAGLHLVNKAADWQRILTDPWHVKHTVPHLASGTWLYPDEFREAILPFFGVDELEFWAYVGAYDWVALNQVLWGPLTSAPHGWPKHYHDLKVALLAVPGGKLRHKQGTIVSMQHNALADAEAVRATWRKEFWEGREGADLALVLPA